MWRQFNSIIYISVHAEYWRFTVCTISTSSFSLNCANSVFLFYFWCDYHCEINWHFFFFLHLVFFTIIVVFYMKIIFDFHVISFWFDFRPNMKQKKIRSFNHQSDIVFYILKSKTKIVTTRRFGRTWCHFIRMSTTLSSLVWNFHWHLSNNIKFWMKFFVIFFIRCDGMA